jgi:chaperone BCS1
MNQQLTSISTSLVDEVSKFQTDFVAHFHIWLANQLTNNDFLIAGVGTVALSAAMYLLRNVPFYIWDFLSYRFTVKVTVFNNNPIFYDLTKELNKKTIQLFSRHKMLDKSHLTVGLGSSVSWFLGRLVFVERSQEKSDSREFKQTLTLVFPFLTHKKLVKLFERFIAEKDVANRDTFRVYSLENNYLNFMKTTPKRPVESIFLPKDVVDHIHERINFFLTNRDWYRKRGIPYKYAILLHGVPGTGKTTLAKYIASFTNRNMVLVTPSKLSRLSTYISNADNDYYDEGYGEGTERKDDRYIGLMEDIDCDDVTHKREETKKKRLNKTKVVDEDNDDESTAPKQKNIFVNLSDLLNSIDGLNSPEDFILIATTNHINQLDPALLRKGRFDDIIEIKPLETPEIVRMISVFREDVGTKLNNLTFNPIPGSVLQDLILQHLDDPVEVLIEKLNERTP